MCSITLCCTVNHSVTLYINQIKIRSQNKVKNTEKGKFIYHNGSPTFSAPWPWRWKIPSYFLPLSFWWNQLFAQPPPPPKLHRKMMMRLEYYIGSTQLKTDHAQGGTVLRCLIARLRGYLLCYFLIGWLDGWLVVWSSAYLIGLDCLSFIWIVGCLIGSLVV